MTKMDLIEKIAKDAMVSESAADKMIDSFVEGIITSVKNGEKATLAGFGSFSMSQRKARVGRNPQTGAEIKIPARKVPKFTPGLAFKKAVE